MPASLSLAQGVVLDGTAPVRTTPLPQPLSLPAGTDADVRVTAVDSSGAAVVLTGATCTLGIKQYANDPGVALLSIVGTVQGSPNTNVVDFALSAAQLTTLGAGSFVWDVVVEWSDSKTTQIVPVSPLTIAPSF